MIAQIQIQNTKKNIYLLTEAGAMINGETIDYNSPPPTMSWTFAQCFAILPFCQWFTPKDPIEGNFIDLELSQDLRGGRFE